MSEKFETPLISDLNEWEDESKDRAKTREELAKKVASGNYDNPDELTDVALNYMAQIKDLEQQLQVEYMKIQRVEMAVKGFKQALKEEMTKKVNGEEWF
jgi:hypothetical protein